MTKQEIKSLCGINFPKFNTTNGYEYFAHLQDLNEHFDEIIYGMPIIEDETVAYKETRLTELFNIKSILDKYRDLVLQVRVGRQIFHLALACDAGLTIQFTTL